MTAPNATPSHAALAAVQQLEGALDQRDDARDLALAALASARSEAERLVADARAAGTEEGRRRQAALLEDAETDAAEIRANGKAAAAELLRRAAAGRAALVAEFAALVLRQEA